MMFGGSRSRPSETARPSQAMPPFSPLSTIGSHSNFIHRDKDKDKEKDKSRKRKINRDHIRQHKSFLDDCFQHIFY